MNKDDKDILSGIGDVHDAADTLSEDDDILINELFSQKKEQPVGNTTGKGSQSGMPESAKAVVYPQASDGRKRPLRSDARYTMSKAEIDTLAAAAEDAVASGRYGAALDSVFFTAGAAREALRKKLNIRIPIGSSDNDLPVIAAATLIESYLENEDINGSDIVEKLRLIIESSEDENKLRPTPEQTELRVFECVLILCVQAEQSGRHEELKSRLYGNSDSFLCAFLDENIGEIMNRHRKELQTFYTSVKLQSRAVSEILEKYMSSGTYALPFPVRFFAESKPVLITAISAGVLCLISIIVYIATYGNVMSFIATDNFLMSLIIILELLFCAGLFGVSWLVYTSGENPKSEKKQ